MQDKPEIRNGSNVIVLSQALSFPREIISLKFVFMASEGWKTKKKRKVRRVDGLEGKWHMGIEKEIELLLDQTFAHVEEV